MRTGSIHIERHFPKHLFWDVDLASLDIDRDRDLIIPRALLATTADSFQIDILRLEALYTKATITRELRSTKERISNQVCTLVARRYHVKKFTRYQRHESSK